MLQLRYLVHPEPAWRDRGDTRLPVKIPRYAGEPEQWIEELWCRRLGDNRYELCCIPFWLPELALGSEVEPDHPDLAARLAIRRSSGRTTLWAMAPSFPTTGIEGQQAPTPKAGSERARSPKVGGAESSALDETAAELAELGCLLEWHRPAGILAIDAEQAAQAQATFNLLWRRQQAGELRFGKTCVPSIATHRPLAAPHDGGVFVHAWLGAPPGQLRWERLSARQLTPNRFRLTDAPFFASGLARGDEVVTEPEPRELAENVVRRVAARSGRLTVRLRLPADAEHIARTLVNAGAAFSCRAEWYSDTVVSLDVPHEAARELEPLLAAAEQRGELSYIIENPRGRAGAATLPPLPKSGTKRAGLGPHLLE